MIHAHLGELGAACAGRLVGADVPVAGVSTDSRTLDAGNLFVALQGPRFDGHAFLEAARRRGAAAALVARAVPGDTLPALHVADTLRALGDIARFWRSRFALPVVGVTGSNGKTTVKEMIAAILARTAPVLATRGNLNNDIGVPLTLLGLDAAHRGAVVEMGASAPGDIARLAGIARPDVGVVTQCAPAHLEGFGDLEGVARAKGELFAALGPDGVAVINADDAYAPLWHELAGARRVLTFGLHAAADVRAGARRRGAHGQVFSLEMPSGRTEVELAFAGEHNVANALAAAAAALALGRPLDEIAAGLNGARPVHGRLHVLEGRLGCMLIDDSYNANPASLEAGLAVLGELCRPRWLVLGDMLELGAGAAASHAEAGRRARGAGVERLFTLGPLAAHAAEAFGERASAFEDCEALGDALIEALPAGASVLVKGSRGMRMERIVERLRAREDRRCC